MAKTTPWAKIKAEYLQRVPPRELAKKYKIKAKAISDRATKEGWTLEKTQICAEVRKSVEDDIKEGAKEAVTYLREAVNNSLLEAKDRISAAKGLLDVSGLKSSKQEITGKDGAPLTVQKEYILPDEVKEFEKHYNDALGE